MGGQSVRHVTATERSGHVYQGVQDIDTGVVYPFPSASTCVEVVAAVNAGEDRIDSYAPMPFPDGLLIEEVR